MATQKTRRGLGRGLSALIPDADMEFLSRVARGDISSLATSTPKAMNTNSAKLAMEEPLVVEDTAGSTNIIANDLPETPAQQLAAANKPDATSDLAQLVAVERIEANPYQPRRHFSAQEMEDLVASVREHGVLQPILVRPVNRSEASDFENTNKARPDYQIVAGERRWRAAAAAGVAQIPAIVRDVTDQQALELAVIENVQRHDITALDAALAYRRLVQEFSLSQEDVARRVGKSRSTVANTLRLLDLPPEVQKGIEDGILSEGHGRAILLAGGDGARRAVFRRVIRDQLSVRDTENLARQALDEADKTADGKAASTTSPTNRSLKNQASPEIQRIETQLQKRLGTRVRIKRRRQGGQISIQYFSNEELERLLKILAP